MAKRLIIFLEDFIDREHNLVLAADNSIGSELIRTTIVDEDGDTNIYYSVEVKGKRVFGGETDIIDAISKFNSL